MAPDELSDLVEALVRRDLKEREQINVLGALEATMVPRNAFFEAL